MMIEALASFSVAQSVAGAAAPTPSTKWLNLQTSRQLLMSGDGNLFVELRVTTAFDDASTGLAGLLPVICTSSAADGGGTIVGHLTPWGVLDIGSNTALGLPAIQLLLNRTVYLPLPLASIMVSGLTTLSAGLPDYLQQYLGMVYVNPAAATTPWIAGALSARLVAAPRGFVGYRDGIA